MKGVRGRLWREGAFADGHLLWERGRIARIGSGPPPRTLAAAVEDLGRTRLVPGFVDTLLHGFAGVDTNDGDADALDHLATALARSGVTSACAGMYPESLAALRGAARRWHRWRARRTRGRTRFLGWHLEGPFIPAEMAGGLPTADLLEPSARAARRLLAACGGWLRICTLAPELPGALAAARVLRDGGVLPSIGHTRAGFAECAALAAEGEVAMTHLGNRCLPFVAREPASIGFAMAGGPDWIAAIPDGVHVAPAALEIFASHPRMAGKLMFVSDDLAAAGTAAVAFHAGGKALHRDGVAARDAGGALAGTLEPLPELLRRRVAAGELSLAQAISGGCEVPGRWAGDCGRLAAGLRADLVALDARGGVARVWLGGRAVS